MTDIWAVISIDSRSVNVGMAVTQQQPYHFTSRERAMALAVEKRNGVSNNWCSNQFTNYWSQTCKLVCMPPIAATAPALLQWFLLHRHPPQDAKVLNMLWFSCELQTCVTTSYTQHMRESTGFQPSDMKSVCRSLSIPGPPWIQLSI